MDPKSRFLWISAAILVAAVAGVVYITQNFITTVLLSFFLAYILYPFYLRLLNLTKRKRISALLSISIVFLIFLVFVLSVINALATEVSFLYASQDSWDETASRLAEKTAGNIFEWTAALAEDRAPAFIAPHLGGLIALAEDQLAPVLAAPAAWLVPEVLPRIKNIVTGLADWIAGNLPILMAQFGVAILLTYYLLVDGAGSIEKFLRLLPERALVRRFLGELNSIYNSLFNVYLINSLLTGLIAAFVYLIVGVPYPFLWGMVTAVFALIPLIGTSAVYVPMALYYLLVGEYLKVAALLILGTAFLNIFPENIMRPALARAGAAIHPAVTLLAFAAPIFVIGVMGVIVGPALYGFVLAAYRTRLSMMEDEAGVVAGPGGRAPPPGASFLSFEGLRRCGRRMRGFLSRISGGRI
ncbi:AI-2E family transporter [Candidatus Methanocrinis natronophilus]|uniref:AI-2E family transporter n=1 Tax=Candidatus Methanocrinis natronophilus TaxID=3033396 RepID=A0ABT5X5L1_9EURY|nr:AI-2E family transporter [Candidatus Methanocrinis natronophilus]MDF0589872.1 AI-2E family transporter [Candidatus Methanocrinis natronophilus]